MLSYIVVKMTIFRLTTLTTIGYGQADRFDGKWLCLCSTVSRDFISPTAFHVTDRTALRRAGRRPERTEESGKSEDRSRGSRGHQLGRGDTERDHLSQAGISRYA